MRLMWIMSRIRQRLEACGDKEWMLTDIDDPDGVVATCAAYGRHVVTMAARQNGLISATTNDGKRIVFRIAE